jgi:hypothetical protein
VSFKYKIVLILSYEFNIASFNKSTITALTSSGKLHSLLIPEMHARGRSAGRGLSVLISRLIYTKL